jgi:hypothetical protein
MNDINLSFATPCEAIRVFCGFPNAQLSEAQFFAQLGRTFMPGTPYMLQPLGLAAYLPGVLSNPEPGLPHEFALICYPSQSVYTQTMTNTLRGRIYSQTHGGVYAIPPSSAAFPILIDNLPQTGVDPYFLFPTPIDWQTGVTHVAVAPKKDASLSGMDFRLALRAAWFQQRPKILTAGIDQVVVASTDFFTVIWIHGATPDLPLFLDFLSNIVTTPIVLRNERVLCIDEPPMVNITGSSAFNFIFVREDKYFLK